MVTERYQYDGVGNFLEFIHKGANPADPGWTRSYTYNEASLLEPGKTSNRLSRTAVSGSQPLIEPYTYDLHGNIASMPQLQAMQWDFKDQLYMTRRQAVNANDQEGAHHQGERTYYVYDSTGQRVRKATESSEGVKLKERFYLGGFELYREYDAMGDVTLARESLHVMDDKKRVALVETTTADASAAPGTLPSTTKRYQFDNHLGTACLELDETAAVITYEEYYPYGSTSYQSGRTLAEVSLKRYRYTGKERDDETGFSYHGARHYAAWLGRWTSCDPMDLIDGLNLYAYVDNNPIRLRDETGFGPDDKTEPKGAHGEDKKHSQRTKDKHERANERRDREQKKRQEKEREQKREQEKKNPKKETDTERKQRENQERKERYKKEGEAEREKKEEEKRKETEEEKRQREKEERRKRQEEKKEREKKRQDKKEKPPVKPPVRLPIPNPKPIIVPPVPIGPPVNIPDNPPVRPPVNPPVAPPIAPPLAPPVVAQPPVAVPVPPVTPPVEERFHFHFPHLPELTPEQRRQQQAAAVTTIGVGAMLLIAVRFAPLLLL